MCYECHAGNDALPPKEQFNNDAINTAKRKGIQVVQNSNQETQDVFLDPGKKYAGLSKSDKEAQQKTDLKQLLSKYADVQFIARIVLPRTQQKKSLWQKMSEEQKKEYLDLFYDDVVNTYYNMLSVEHKKKVDLFIKRAKAIPRKRGFYQIRVQGIFKSTPPVNLSWTLTKGKIIDLRIEGASMLQSKKAEYKALARGCMTSGGVVDINIFLSKIKRRVN